MSLCLHLKNPHYNNWFPSHVLTHETEQLIRVVENLLNNFSVELQEGIQEEKNRTKMVNMAIKRKIKENHLNGFVITKITTIETYHHENNNQRNDNVKRLF